MSEIPTAAYILEGVSERKYPPLVDRTRLQALSLELALKKTVLYVHSQDLYRGRVIHLTRRKKTRKKKGKGPINKAASRGGPTKGALTFFCSSLKKKLY